MKALTATEQDHEVYKQMTVLVAEGVDTLRSTIVSMLSEFGFKRVIQASSGLEVISLIQKQNVELIIADSQLPKVSGVELLSKVRRHSKLNKIPFVITSSSIEQSEVIKAIKNGVSEYVVKPFSAKILVERVKKAIDNPIKQTASLVNAKGKNKQDADAEKLSVLVVDDVPDNIQLISHLLKTDYKIKAATSGEVALKISVSDQPPDLILLDIMMPNMDGLEVCKRLKADSRTQHITVIFLTALDQNEDIVKGLKLGAVDYITKPVQPEILKARLANHANAINAHKKMRDQVDTLIEVARLREEFDRVTRNDLKIPLTEISQCVGLIENNLKDANRVRQSADAIKSSVSQLNHMVDNLLTLGKIEEGTYQFEPVMLDMKGLVFEVIKMFVTSYNRKKLEIHNNIEDGIKVSGEKLLSISLISNLFKNAIEAAPRGSAIRLSYFEDEQFHVLNMHNIGSIPEEIRETFFDKYVTHGKKDAAGIGTYAAKIMAEVQKGKLRFQTSEKSGTTLLISFLKA